MEIIIGSVIGILGIIVSIIIARYQVRTAKISVKFYLNENGDPSRLSCQVINNGNKAAKNVIVGFNHVLPYDTVVISSAENMIQLVESESVLHPSLYPHSSKKHKAFTIKIPRVPPNDTIKFELRSVDEDNQRAAKQIIRIRQEIIEILRDFYSTLSDKKIKMVKQVDINSLISSRIKNENFFFPDNFSYDEGRDSVEFITEKEIKVIALNQDLYARYKEEYLDIFQGRPKFIAPVIKIKLDEGPATYAIFPPYIKTYLDVKVPLEELKEKEKIMLNLPIPHSYE